MSPSQGARETRRESSPMLAGGAHGTVWDDSRCAPRAFSRSCSRTRAPLMYSGPRRAGTDGQTSLGTGPAPAAPAGPNGGVLLLSVQNRPVADRARNALRIVPDACMCCNVGHLGRFAASFARDRVCVSSQAHSPDVHTRGGGSNDHPNRVLSRFVTDSDNVAPGAGSPTSVS